MGAVRQALTLLHSGEVFWALFACVWMYCILSMFGDPREVVLGIVKAVLAIF